MRENNLDLNLMEHQLLGVEYVRNHRISYLAFDMGLGKTAIGLKLPELLKVRSVWIICPGYLRDNWKSEALKWGWEEEEVQVILTRKSKLQYLPVTISSYDPATIKNICKQSFGYSVLICDEAHYLRGRKAKRTKYITGSDVRIKKPAMLYAERTVFLSGTPMLSRPRELWAILRSVFKDDVNIKDYYQYANQYCAAFTGQFGIDDSGASNLEDLKKSYLDKFMYRLEKEEVIDLPEKVYVDIDLELNAEVTTTLNKEIEFSIDIDELIKGTVSIGEYATVRRELGLLKLEKCIEYIQNVLDTTGAVVVFTYHVQLAEELSKHFKTAHITGATPNPIRTNVVRNFQEFGGVIIGTYGAMGTGITLTKSSNVVLCELEYSPRLIDQAVDRCHRIGQKNNVTIHTLLWKKGLERDLYYDLKKKDKTFKSLF